MPFSQRSAIVTSAAAEVPFKPSAARLPTSAAEVINIPGWKVRDEYIYIYILLLLLPPAILRDWLIGERRERSHSKGYRKYRRN